MQLISCIEDFTTASHNLIQQLQQEAQQQRNATKAQQYTAAGNQRISIGSLPTAKDYDLYDLLNEVLEKLDKLTTPNNYNNEKKEKY